MIQKGSWSEQNATFFRHKTNQWSKYVIAIHYIFLCNHQIGFSCFSKKMHKRTKKRIPFNLRNCRIRSLFRRVARWLNGDLLNLLLLSVNHVPRRFISQSCCFSHSSVVDIAMQHGNNKSNAPFWTAFQSSTTTTTARWKADGEGSHPEGPHQEAS